MYSARLEAWCSTASSICLPPIIGRQKGLLHSPWPIYVKARQRRQRRKRVLPPLFHIAAERPSGCKLEPWLLFRTSRPGSQAGRLPPNHPTNLPAHQAAGSPGGRAGRQPAHDPPNPPARHSGSRPAKSPRPHADPTPGHPGRQPPSQAASPPATCPANQPPVQAASKTARLPSSPPFRVPVRQAVGEPAARPAAEVTDKPAIQPSRPRSSLHSKLLRSPALRSMHAGSLVRALCIRPLELR